MNLKNGIISSAGEDGTGERVKKTLVRYKLNLKLVGHLVFLNKPPSASSSSYEENTFYVKFRVPPYYLDILDSAGAFRKMKIYMEDGSVIIGWQHTSFIEVHHIGDPLDGRFNSDAND